MTALHARQPIVCARFRVTRRMLLLSCALGTSLALGAAPQRAAAQAFDATPTTAFGAVVYDRAMPGVETVQVESNTAIIEWRPLVTPTPPEYLFLPGGNTATFRNGPNNTDFVVLNRILSPLPSRFDGTVLSRIFDALGNSAPGGTVLFSSPAGIIIGSTAVFDIGNLVLTTLNVVDDGAGNFVTPGGGFQFDGGAAQPNAAVVTEAGSQIIATVEGSYLALVAPRIVHGGSAQVNGSVGYVAAEEAEITVNQGLFDIILTTGSDNANPIIHTGVTGGPASTGGIDNHRIYMAAIPKNQAITALLSGSVGFDAATDVTIENGAIVLTAGYPTVFGDFVSTTDPSLLAASFLIQGGTITSDLTGYAVTDFFASGATASLTFTQDVSLFAGERARLFAANGQNVAVAGNALLSSARTANPDGSVDVTGGETLLFAESGGSVTVAGDVSLDASGTGVSSDMGVGDGTGGTARIFADDSTVQITGDVEIIANGTGAGSYYSMADAGDGFGGTAAVAASNQGSVVITGDLSINADGIGGAAGYSTGSLGEGTGGTTSAQATGQGNVAVAGNVEIAARGFGGTYSDFGVSGSVPIDGALGRGGSVEVSAADDGEIEFAAGAQLFATGQGSDGFTGGSGGDGEGGSATVLADGGQLDVAQLEVNVGGTGGAGGAGVEDGLGNPGAGGTGGQGGGGQAVVQAGPGGTLTIESLLVDAGGTGGAGGVGSSGLAGGLGGTGGAGVGGLAQAGATGGQLTATGIAGLSITASGQGGTGGVGGASIGGPGGGGGVGGAGAGGSAVIEVSGGSVSSDVTDLDSAGIGGAGGAGGTGPVAGSAGVDANGTGGVARISVADGNAASGGASLGVTNMAANARSGSGAAMAGDVAGRLIIEDLGTVASGLQFAELIAGSTGQPSPGGPAFAFTSDAGQVTVAGDVNINVAGDISFTAAGDGGLEAGGSVVAITDGSILLDHVAPTADAATVSGADVTFEAGTSIVGSADSVIAATGEDAFLMAPVVDVGGVTAARDVLVEAGTITIVSAVAGRDVKLEADDDILVGFAEAGDDFLAVAGGAFSADTVVTTGNGPDSDGEIVPPVPDGSNIVVDADGDIRLDDGNAAGAVRLASANGSVASDGLLSAGTDLDISAAGNAALADAQAGGEIALAAGGDLVAGELTAGGAIDVNVGGAAAIASAGSGASVTVDSAGDLRLDDGAAAGSIFLTSANGSVASDGLLAAGTDLFIAADADIAINDVEAGGAIGLAAAGDLDAADLTAGDDITASAGGAVTIASGDSAGSIGVTAAGAAMLGTFAAAQDIGIAAVGIALTSVTAGRDISLVSGANVDVGTAVAGDDFSAMAAGTFAADRVDATGEGPDSESGSGALAGAGNVAIEAGGDLRLDNADAARDVSLASTSGSISSSGVIAAGRAFAATAGSDFVMGDAAVLSAGTADITAGGDAMFNLVAAQTFTVAAGGTATFLGNVDAETIDVTSADIEIMAGGSLGADITQTVSLTALATGQPTVVGGADQGPGYTLSDAEANRITTALLRLQAPQNGTDAGRDPDLVVRDLALTGERIGQLELLTAGIMEVSGALLLSDVRTDGGVTLRGGERLQIVTPDGSVRVRDGAGMPGGTLTLESSHIWSASRGLIDQLIADRDFAGRNEALLLNDGPVEPRGYIEAADVALRAGETLFVQNSGDADFFAGITVVGNTLTVTPTGDAPLIVYAFGRRINPDGSFVTNNQFFAEVVFQDRGGTIGYTDESEFNRCVINTGICPAAAPDPDRIDIPGGPDIIEEPVGGLFASRFPADGGGDLVDTSFSAEPLVEEPVTSGGDSILWDCDMDGDGDCDEDD